MSTNISCGRRKLQTQTLMFCNILNYKTGAEVKKKLVLGQLTDGANWPSMKLSFHRSEEIELILIQSH